MKLMTSSMVLDKPMTLQERIYAAQQKDVIEMQGIYDAVATGSSPELAAALLVGGHFQLSEGVKTVLLQMNN